MSTTANDARLVAFRAESAERELVMLKPYMEKGMTKGEAVAAYEKDQAAARAAFERRHPEVYAKIVKMYEAIDDELIAICKEIGLRWEEWPFGIGMHFSHEAAAYWRDLK